MLAPYIISADFKALNIPAEGAARYSCISNTRLVAKEVPCIYCYVVVCCEMKSKIIFYTFEKMR